MAGLLIGTVSGFIKARQQLMPTIRSYEQAFQAAVREALLRLRPEDDERDKEIFENVPD